MFLWTQTYRDIAEKKKRKIRAEKNINRSIATHLGGTQGVGDGVAGEGRGNFVPRSRSAEPAERGTGTSGSGPPWTEQPRDRSSDLFVNILSSSVSVSAAATISPFLPVIFPRRGHRNCEPAKISRSRRLTYAIKSSMLLAISFCAERNDSDLLATPSRNK